MKLCAIDSKELEEKILTRFAENQNDELLEDLSDYVINSQKEIERLNNIINEFEEELKWQRKVCLSLNEGFAVSRIDTLTNKLQELKGDDKE